MIFNVEPIKFGMEQPTKGYLASIYIPWGTLLYPKIFDTTTKNNAYHIAKLSGRKYKSWRTTVSNMAYAEIPHSWVRGDPTPIEDIDQSIKLNGHRWLIGFNVLLTPATLISEEDLWE